MHVFTIRDIENLTGIKAHTIRIWEQRYNLMNPQRKTGNHRLYSNEDLKHLLKISTLYHNGHKISKIAALTAEQINQFTLDTLVINDPFQVYVNQLLESAIDFDEDRLEKIIHTCLLHYSFDKTIFKVLFPFLNKVGLLWTTGHVVPAMEHFASYLIMKKIVVAIDGLEKPEHYKGPVVVLFTPEAERHEMPVLMMQYLLKKNGVRTVMLGQHVSLDTLTDYCNRKPADYLYTHVITHLQRHDRHEYVAELSRRFPGKQIIVSGTVMQSLQKNFLNVKVLKSHEAMIAFRLEF
jgi:MerR family transcriptional regulator, light-induced transcriptional regulator